MITNPPPYESAPTFNATQASAAMPPPVLAPAASNGHGAARIACPLSDAPRRRSPSSINPQAKSTSTTHRPAARPRLDKPGGEEREHAPGPGGGGGGAAEGRVPAPPAAQMGAAPPARAEPGPGVHRHGRHGGASARACSQDPGRRAGGEEQG